MITWVLAACTALTASAQDDPLAKFLIPPGFIMEKADTIGLTEEQRSVIREAAEQAHEKNSGKTPAMKEAIEGLGKELQKEGIDEEAAKTKLDTLLDAERALKQVHLQLLIVANNVLTT